MILYLRLSEGIVAILLQRIYRFTFRFVAMICKISKMLKRTFYHSSGKIIISHVIKCNFVILNATLGNRSTDR